MADRRVEIVADYGTLAKVGVAVWGDTCRDMEVRIRAGKFQRGAIEGIVAIAEPLQMHFPAGSGNTRINSPIRQSCCLNNKL